MLSKPFAISGISDPSQVRVVLYEGQHFVHAPLNGLLDLLRSSLRSEFDGSIQALEERIKVLSSELEELKECSF
ncbi:hypothetical protein NPX99_05975 [Bartonella sp. 220]|uniref:hypothetical protein n=1 Tax=Bartonella sp. 220B TaxID=2967260 RepID=UPI0022A976C8|nr:hypothetical protein [Bartonella sp. 220B]MCZ2158817.1 hypothetical protein [Bartonella sp. 220B]